MTEAERIAQELVEEIDGFPQATKLEQEAAALLRSQAAEIERLREALGKLHSNARWINDEQAIVRDVDMIAARAALGVKHD